MFLIGIFLYIPMKTSELKAGDYNPYYQTYINTLGEDAELLNVLNKQSNNFPQFMGSIPDDKLHYAYAEGKWSVAEVLQHIIDTERVFQYRALRFSRNDATPLPGFDQDVFADGVQMENSTKETIIAEYSAVRASTIALFASFDNEALKRLGTASDSPMSVGALGFITCGHQRHHRNVLRERYL